MADTREIALTLPFRPAAPRTGAAVPHGERQILNALEEGDRDTALRLLMREYGSAVYRYCRQMLGDDLADEVHQMTFVQAYEGMARFAGRSSLRTWLFGIAHHRCLDALKISRRREKRFQPLDGVPDPPAPAETAEDRLAGRSRVRALERCLRELAPRVRAAVLLRFQQGVTYEEMAVLEGERAPTLQARVVRALPVLRRCLERKGWPL